MCRSKLILQGNNNNNENVNPQRLQLGCYAEFITVAIILENRINQGPFIRKSTVLGAAILSIVKEGELLSWQVGRAKTALTKGVNDLK